jgi:hypothetical protein
VSSVCTTISYRWQKAKAAYCLDSYESPADLQHALKRGDGATVARLAAAAYADETALLCLLLCMAPRLRRLAMLPAYERLDVSLQSALWRSLARPLLHPHIAADEIEGRLTGGCLQPEVRKVVRRKKLAPTDALPDATDDTAPELAAAKDGDLDLRLDMEAATQRLTPAQRRLVVGTAVYGVTKGEWAKILDLTPDGAKTAQRRALEAARDETEED